MISRSFIIYLILETQRTVFIELLDNILDCINVNWCKLPKIVPLYMANVGTYVIVGSFVLVYVLVFPIFKFLTVPCSN